jgi:hypothetical protein
MALAVSGNLLVSLAMVALVLFVGLLYAQGSERRDRWHRAKHR